MIHFVSWVLKSFCTLFLLPNLLQIKNEYGVFIRRLQSVIFVMCQTPKVILKCL